VPLRPVVLRRQPGGAAAAAAFVAIEGEHARLHRLAARVLRESATNAAISTGDYDELLAGSARLRVEIDSLRHELESALRNRDTLTGVYGRIEICRPCGRRWSSAAVVSSSPASRSWTSTASRRSTTPTGTAWATRSGDGGALRRSPPAHLRQGVPLRRRRVPDPAAGVHVDGAHRLVERLRAGLAATDLATTETGERLRLTASFGVTPLEPTSARRKRSTGGQGAAARQGRGPQRVIRWDPSVTTAALQDARGGQPGRAVPPVPSARPANRDWAAR